MSLFNNTKGEQNKRRPPDDVGAVSDEIGVAIWANSDGDHDVKIGELLKTRKKSLIVRQTVPLSLFRDKVDAIRTVAEAFANQSNVPAEIRQDLGDLAVRLGAALQSEPAQLAESSEGGNGLFGSA